MQSPPSRMAHSQSVGWRYHRHTRPQFDMSSAGRENSCPDNKYLHLFCTHCPPSCRQEDQSTSETCVTTAAARRGCRALACSLRLPIIELLVVVIWLTWERLDSETESVGGELPLTEPLNSSI